MEELIAEQELERAELERAEQERAEAVKPARKRAPLARALKREIKRQIKRERKRGMKRERKRQLKRDRERERDERRLATTPVSFSYSGTTGVAGYDSTRPFASAFETSSTGLGKTAGAVLTIAGLILPWALLVGLIVLVVRLIRRRNQTVATPATTE